MYYSFDVAIAVEYGEKAAIMINNLQFWIAKNRADGRHFYEGRYWTFSSSAAFVKLFPFWSKRQIEYILQGLVDKGVLIKGNFNRDKMDRTLWYAFTDEFDARFLGGLGNADTKNVESNYKNCNIPRDDNSGDCIYKNCEMLYNTDIKTKQILKDKRLSDSDSETSVSPSVPDMQEGNFSGENPGDSGNLFPVEDVPETIYLKEEEKRKVAPKEKRGTTEGLCLFVNSRYYDLELFKEAFSDPKYSEVDLEYYYESVRDWSAGGSKKKHDWIATARNFMRGDMEKGKLRKSPQENKSVKYMRAWYGFDK